MLAQELADGFVPQNRLKYDDIAWINAKSAPIKTYGVFYDEKSGCYLRISPDIAACFDDVFSRLNMDTAGGRVRFKTNSPYIALYAAQTNNIQLNIMTLCGQSGFDLYRDNVYAETFLPKTNVKNGFCDIIETDGEMHEYTVNFPLFDNVNSLYIGLCENAFVFEAAPHINEGGPIVFYGSSITQGACASRPGMAYPARVCRRFNADYVNLGFASRCRGQKEMAEYIRGLSMSAFVMGFDHNAENAEELSLRHNDFYRTIRESDEWLFYHGFNDMWSKDLKDSKEFNFPRNQGARRRRRRLLPKGRKNIGIHGAAFLDSLIP